MKCRHCGTELNLPLIDLGAAPPSNAYLTAESLHAPEKWFPLRVLVCEQCWLVQTEDYTGAEDLFTRDYAYFSSISSSWLRHAEQYVSAVVDRFALGANSFVLELASNDGYLLQYVRKKGIPCLGIEPTASTAAVARSKGIEVIESFFGVELSEMLAGQGRQADLIVANNVLAHVPDINDFVSGVVRLLKPDGVATFEFPHLLRLIKDVQFDTIYHEHFSYLSLMTVMKIFERNGLECFDVQELPTHGGSLRVYAQRCDAGRQKVGQEVARLLQGEEHAGVASANFYLGFQAKANQVKNDLLEFLIDANREGKPVAAYGAAAKGNTLLNFAGVRSDLLPYVVDRNPAKQGKFMPGSRIPIVDESRIRETHPSWVIILPWNLRTEIERQLSYVRSWGGRLVTAIPRLNQT
jgi:SAM-dependent methyltransferase